MFKGNQARRVPRAPFHSQGSNEAGNRQAGFGLIELFIGSAVLAIAIIGTAVGVLTSYQLAIKTKKSNLANDMALSVAEECLDAATTNFDTALGQFHLREEIHDDIKVTTEIVLDETVFATPIDLNGDGDFLDTNLLPSECTAAFLRTTITFSSGDTRTYLNMVARKTKVLSTVTASATRQTQKTLDAKATRIASAITVKASTDSDLTTDEAAALKLAVESKTASWTWIRKYREWLAAGSKISTTTEFTKTSSEISAEADKLYAQKVAATSDDDDDAGSDARCSTWEQTYAKGTITWRNYLRSNLEVRDAKVVIAVRFDTFQPKFIGGLKINGVRVYNNPFRPAPTGSLIKVTPFKLHQGFNHLSRLVIKKTSTGGYVSTDGLKVMATFYFQSGEKARFLLRR